MDIKDILRNMSPIETINFHLDTLILAWLNF